MLPPATRTTGEVEERSMIPVSSARLRRAIAMLAAPALLLSPAAFAQDKKDADPFDPLRACRAISVDAERLACFDRVAASLVTAADEGDLSVVNREEVRKTRRTLFGFALPDLGIFGRSDKAREKDAADEVEVLNTTVASARTTADGLEVTTAEGAIWLIGSPPRRLMTPRAGQSIELRRGSLTSYFMRINGQGGVKARRIG